MRTRSPSGCDFTLRHSWVTRSLEAQEMPEHLDQASPRARLRPPISTTSILRREHGAHGACHVHTHVRLLLHSSWHLPLQFYNPGEKGFRKYFPVLHFKSTKTSTRGHRTVLSRENTSTCCQPQAGQTGRHPSPRILGDHRSGAAHRGTGSSPNTHTADDSHQRL